MIDWLTCHTCGSDITDDGICVICEPATARVKSDFYAIGFNDGIKGCSVKMTFIEYLKGYKEGLSRWRDA